MPKKIKKKPGLKKAVATDNIERKLISRLEAARVLGCSPQTVKRMEKRHGGTLDEVKLRGPKSVTYYKVDQLNEAFGININA